MKLLSKVFFSCLLALCISQLANSQSVTGRVTDARTGQPIESATISYNSGQFTLTDAAGYFELTRVAQTGTSMEVTSVGYKLVRRNIQAGENVEVALERYDLFMQPVEVKAIRAGDKAPFTKTNISKKDIEKLNLGQDLPFLLDQVPSVIVNSDAGNGIGYTGLRIRGSDATRINMTINGIPYNDAESQGLFFVNLPDLASSVSSIQVQRGVGTSSNGAGAFGATINFSTNEVNTIPYAEINNAFGSFNTWKHTIKAGTGLLNDHFTIDARLSKINSDGYIDRASTDLKSFYVSAAYLSNKSSIRLNIMSGNEKTYQAWNGVSEADLKINRTVNYAGMERPGSPYDNEVDNYQQDHYQLFFNHEFSGKLALNTAVFLTKGKGYYEQYKAGESYGDYGLPPFTSGNETIEETDLIRQLWLDNEFYGQVFSLMYKSNADQIDLGGGWSKYAGNHFGQIIWAQAGISDNYRWYNNPASKTDFNAYAKYQRKIGTNLYLFGDVQVRHINYELNGFRDNPDIYFANKYTFLNPKVGITYSNRNHQLYASYSKASKEPNRDDFEAGGNEQPVPEHLHDLELGYEWRNANTQLQTTLYYMMYRDQLVLTGKVNDVGAYTRTNIPESYRAGIELSAAHRLGKSLRISANASFSKNRISDFTEYYDDYDDGGQKSVNHGTTDIAFSPAVVAGASVEWTPVKGLRIAAPAKYVSRQYLDNTNNKARSLSSYYVQNLHLSYTLSTKKFREISFLVQINNVFNRLYEPNGYTFSYQYEGQMVTENYYFPMAGTNLMTGINISL